MESYIKGTCEFMCPLKEYELRSKENLLHFFEKPKKNIDDEYRKTVKEFARSAAGGKTPKASDLRTPSALKMTVEYLLNDIFLDKRKPFNVIYDFIFDRFRSIRQDIVIQNLDIKTTSELLEPIIVFLAYSSYRLCEENINTFDPKICNQHLQECLKKVLFFYNELDNNAILYNEKNRIFIEIIYILINLGNNDALNRGINVPTTIKSNHLYKLCLKCSILYWNKNYYQTMKIIQELPTFLAAIASLHLPTIRKNILQSFSVAYHNRVLTVPILWLKSILFYGSNDDLINDLKYYNINIDIKQLTVNFDKNKFNSLQNASLQKCFVNLEKVYSNHNLSEIIQLKNINFINE